MMNSYIPDEKKVEINKTRVENVGFSKRIVDSFRKNNIRTIGGVLARTKSELQSLLGIRASDADEILRKINDIPEIQTPTKQETIQEIGTSENYDATKKNISLKTLQSEDEDDIVRTLAEGLGFTKKEIVGPSRKQEIVRARDLIAFLLREYGDMSFPAIGRLLGDRDHTTVIHACKKVTKMIKGDSALRHGMDNLIESVQAIKERKLTVEKELAQSILAVDSMKTRHVVPVFKKIPERNMKVLDLYREGLTLANIGNEVGVSRERVRQIVAGTVRQMANNESISKEIVMDSDVMLEEESKRRRTAQELKRDGGKKKEPKEKQWSRYHTSCQKCGTTAIPHVRKGLCEQCIGQFRAGHRESIISEHANRCDSCNRTRAEAAALYGRDLYITKDRKVLCKACFRKFSGKRLGEYKNYEWSRFHPKCKSCGTTSIPHAGKGLCEKCAGKTTNEERERLITMHGNSCDVCHIDRDTAQATLGKDFFVTKIGKVLCRTCFQKYARRGLISFNAGKQGRN